ncbi:hypothetical protein SAMN04487781_1104 [Cellulosimicrobium cellulans]|nr:hypothetical protein [Sphaerisporangium cinnabarinum]PTU57481.1 hypothetical protein DBB34_03805 [Sphaerisporangium cinnabarinum]SDF34204.1 hypothetical protein SAMN04487781_1104 [Cellulosimicrobium cellulans]
MGDVDRSADVVVVGSGARTVAVHRDRRGRRFRTDHGAAAVAQGAHAARTALRHVGGGPDPGPYAPDAGITPLLHGAQVAGLGVVGSRRARMVA